MAIKHALMLATTGVAATFLLQPTTFAVETQVRCGWLENPTPGNWFLLDQTAEWMLAAQGASQPTVIDRMPEIADSDFVKTNGPYGYACACVRGSFNPAKRVATEI